MNGFTYGIKQRYYIIILGLQDYYYNYICSLCLFDLICLIILTPKTPKTSFRIKVGSGIFFQVSQIRTRGFFLGSSFLLFKGTNKNLTVEKQKILIPKFVVTSCSSVLSNMVSTMEGRGMDSQTDIILVTILYYPLSSADFDLTQPPPLYRGKGGGLCIIYNKFVIVLFYQGVIYYPLPM